MRKQTGITLVALVITIIVMLILASITLILTIGENGMITKAIEAAVAQKKAGYFEEINFEILEEQTDRIIEPKEDPFILSLQERINKKDWVSSVIMCDQDFIQQDVIENNNVLVVTTKDNYEIIIDVNNIEITAKIREDYFEKVGANYQIKYDRNGGSGNVEEQKGRKGFQILLQQNQFTKAGYIFAGWCEDKNGVGTIYAEGSRYRLEKNVTLYAIWKKDAARIEFDANGGTGSMNIISVDKGSQIKLSLNTFTNTGYEFKEWNTSQDGTGISYQNGADITVNNSLILYAQWEEKVTATLNFNTKELTKGTEITIGATALASEIEQIRLEIGNLEIYSEQLSNAATSYSKKIEPSNLKNLSSLNFYDQYEIKLKVTSKSGITKQVVVSNVQNYTIASANSLKTFANLVNNGNTFAGKKILQVGNIDVKGSSSNNTTMIGYYGTTSKAFSGIYYGENYRIDHVYINNSDDKTTGLFGYLLDGTLNEVTLSGTVISTSAHRVIGGICGRNDGQINKCTNEATIRYNGSSAAGGIAGYAANTNNKASTSIFACTNKGNVIHNYTTLDSTCGTGGIVGRIENNASINACKNEGTINSKHTIGGIVGYVVTENCSILNSNNIVAITGEYNVGGIASINIGKIKYCANKGKLTATDIVNTSDTETATVGGITAVNAGIIQESYNNGEIQISTSDTTEIAGRIGGITGENKGTIEICYNMGNITNHNRAVGGIVGRNDGNVSYCYNAGTIIGISSNGTTGGIIGNHVTGTTLKNYYLSTTAPGGINAQNITGQAESETQVLFKTSHTTSTSVAYRLNQAIGSNRYQVNSSKNQGYPYLINNQP